MIGILALESEAAGANIRTLHYKWLTSHVTQFGIYSTLRRLRELGWVRRSYHPVTLIAWEHKRKSPVYRLTEEGYRALVRYYADTLWLGHVSPRAQKKLLSEAETLLTRIVAKVREFRRAA